jgi:hypothetical protein
VSGPFTGLFRPLGPKSPAVGRDPIQAFIDRWSPPGGAKHANYQLFLGELCDVFTVPRPDATVPDKDQNAYVFEKQVGFQNSDGTCSYGRWN